MFSFRLWIKSFRTFGLKKEVYSFLENLSILLSAGMHFSGAISSVKEEVKSSCLRKILNEIEEDIRSGFSFYKSLKKANLLPPYILAFIKAGESSGQLIENLEVIVKQNEKEEKFRSQLRSVLTYPVIVFILAITIGTATAWFILPKFALFFESIDTELPLLTRALISFGDLMKNYGYFIVPFFFSTLIITFYFLFSFPKTKIVGHLLLFHLPLTGGLIRKAELARVGFFMGTMLKAGMPIKDVLDTLPSSTTYLNYRKFYNYLGGRIKEGISFHQSFEEYPKVNKLFPLTVRKMIYTGEKSGNLPEMLFRSGQIYESKLEQTARNIPTILEPIILIFIGIIVALFAIGVLVPIYSLVNTNMF